ncbi:hypothetical protein MBLNU230_g1766t1 [Neophaeotheca triangularis]
MASVLSFFLVTASLATASADGSGNASNPSTRLYRYVDPLVGTVGSTPGSAIAGGNSFPGASLPWGMVKAGIDTSYIGIPEGLAVDANAGYSPLGNVTGISMTHVSGTGGVPTYGLISQMPIVGDLMGVNLADNTTYWQNRSMDSESATVGLFTTTLLNGVKIEVTSSNHSALVRYHFPSSSDGVNSTAQVVGYDDVSGSGETTSNDAHVLADLTHVLPGYGSQSYSQKYFHGNVHLRSADSGQPSYYGSASYTGGWSQPDLHTLHFCGNFSVPSTSSLQPSNAYVQDFTRDRVSGAGSLSWSYNPFEPPAFEDRPNASSWRDSVAYAGSGQGLGALFSWTPGGNNATGSNVLEARLGISYISAQQACSNVAKELPPSMEFDQVVDQARHDWESKVLGMIEVEDDGSSSSQNTTLKTMLYTALYQTGLMPTDKTGENPYWKTDDSNPYYDDMYTMWDIYRTVMPLYHLIYTQTYSRIISGLISIFTNDGFLPAGRIANWNGRVQGGTHADMVLADAYVKDVASAFTNDTGNGELGAGIDWHEAFAAVLQDGLTQPVRNVDPVCFDGSSKEGRGALEDYLALHYITRNNTRSISRGVEYSQNDFAIWSMAARMSNSTGQVNDFLDRSSWWQNQWDPEVNTTLEGYGTFTGFPAPHNQDGSWNTTDYDPLSCGGCGWADDIYEATVWETAFSAAPHDMAKLIQLMGGDEAFLNRLDATFVPGFGTSVGENNDAGTALYNPGNEPSFATPFLYNYVPGNSWRTVQRTRAIVDEFYSTERNGVPGNIDGGALPSWLVFSLIGMYPVSAQSVYLLSVPRFSALKLHLFSGTPQAKTLAITAPGLSETNIYPQTVTFNGRELDKSWLTHAELSQGGSLVFEMGEMPARWDDGERPPSLSGYQE